jgi:Lon protease-like protein
MTQQCIETRSPFGIVFAEEGHIAETGCTALIAKTLKVHEDGRSDILTVGQKPFHVTRTHNEKAYLEAEIKYLEDDFAGVNPAVSAQVEQLCNQCHRVLYGEDAPRFEPEGGLSLAYHIASELPLDVTFRQTLLELRSEAERQRRLAVRLTEWYPQLKSREHVRGKAGGNGHAKL